MNLNFFFPDYKRNIPFGRWVRILIRTIHLLGITGYGGAIIYSISDEEKNLFFMVTIISGCCLVLLDLYKNGVWIIQNRGIIIGIKIILLISFEYFHLINISSILGIIVISSFISHAPGNFRYYSVFFSKRIDFLPQKNQCYKKYC